MNLDLSGKNALVGGASGGIGKAIALELAALGANVTVMARTQSKLENTVREMDSSKGQQHSYLQVDFSDSQNLSDTVAAKIAEVGVFHILVNNTGGPKGGLIHQADPEEFLQAFHNHVICNQTLAQLLLPKMKTESYGRIINVISTSVREPIPGLGVSNTTRWAVASWAKTLASEVAPWGVTVNNVLPGFTNTDRLGSIITNRAKQFQISEAEMEKRFKSVVPAGRFAEANEVANAAAFLASPAASYITGINIRVDGGRTKGL